MAQQVRRQMNYVDGTAARQMYAAPARRVHEPERHRAVELLHNSVRRNDQRYGAE